MPAAGGTKRALVLVEDDAPPAPEKPRERPEDALSTPKIVEKVLGPR